MATLCEKAFDGKDLDAAGERAAYDPPMIRKVMNRSDWAILLLLALIWGSSFLFIGVAVSEVDPLSYVWIRLVIAAGALWLFLAATGRASAFPRRAIWPLIVLALLNNIAPFLLFAWGQTQIASGLASILNSTVPIWGVVAAHFFTRDEPLTLAKLTGVALGLGGVVVMIGGSLIGQIGGDLLPQLACLLGAFSYALAGVYARRFKAMGMDAISAATGQLTAGAIILAPVALAVGQPWLQPMPSLSAIGAILALALLCTAFGQFLYMRLIATAGATNALLTALLIPPTAVLLGNVVLGEVLELRHFAGMALIGVGLAAIDGRLFRALSPAQLRPAT